MLERRAFFQRIRINNNFHNRDNWLKVKYKTLILYILKNKLNK